MRLFFGLDSLNFQEVLLCNIGIFIKINKLQEDTLFGRLKEPA
jgi:hypothetical protein